MPGSAAELPEPAGLGELLDRWSPRAGGLTHEERSLVSAALSRTLGNAPSREAYDEVRAPLLALGERLAAVAGEVEQLLRTVDIIERAWTEEHRYEPAAVAERVAALRARVQRRPASAGKRWLRDLLAAADDGEVEAAAAIAALAPELPEAVRAGAERIRDALTEWSADRYDAARDVLAQLAGSGLEGWEERLPDDVLCSAHRLLAWLELWTDNDVDTAALHLDAATTLDNGGGHSFAERGAFRLRQADPVRARSDAQRAIELEPDHPDGYVLSGACSEFDGDFDAADAAYALAVERMTAQQLAGRARPTIVEWSGRLLLHVARRLAAKWHTGEALAALDRATATGILGDRRYPDAAAWELKARILSDTQAPVEAVAAAAAEAGRRALWNGDFDDAIVLLRQACAGDPGDPASGWLLADALLAGSFPSGAARPDPQLVGEALEVWEETRRRSGWPRGSTSWAYVTRAFIAQGVGSTEPERVEPATWEALVYVERALAHDAADQTRWMAAAGMLRMVGADALATEAIDRAAALGPLPPDGLYERMALLGNAGRLAEAEELADLLVGERPDDEFPIVTKAWLQMHAGRYADTIAWLEDRPPGAVTVAWRHDVLAVCHAATGDLDAAHAEYVELCRLVTDPVDLQGERLLTVALALAGDVAAARGRLGEIDDACDDAAALETDGYVALMENRLDVAQRRFRAAAERSDSVREFDDVVRFGRFRVSAGSGTSAEREARLSALQAGVAEAAGRRAQLEVTPLTGEQVLAELIARHVDDSAEPPARSIALLAMQARRLAEGGRLEEAADVWARLLDGPFGPEARIAIRRALLAVSDELEARHDVPGVERIQGRLRELRLVDDAEAELSISGALLLDGQRDEALSRLQGAAVHTDDRTRREIIHQRAGELAINANSPRTAADEFGTALVLAQTSGESRRVAQLEARLALAALLDGEAAAAQQHLAAARDAWIEAGAIEPARTLLHDVRSALSAKVSAGVEAALDRLTEQVYPEQRPPE